MTIKTVDPEFISYDENGDYTAEASDLGWRVGCWPDRVEIPGIGTYRRSLKGRDREGDLTHVEYDPTDGTKYRLVVYND